MERQVIGLTQGKEWLILIFQFLPFLNYIIVCQSELFVVTGHAAETVHMYQQGDGTGFVKMPKHLSSKLCKGICYVMSAELIGLVPLHVFMLKWGEAR